MSGASTERKYAVQTMIDQAGSDHSTGKTMMDSKTGDWLEARCVVQGRSRVDLAVGEPMERRMEQATMEM